MDGCKCRLRIPPSFQGSTRRSGGLRTDGSYGETAINSSSRLMQRDKLGELVAATSGRQPVPAVVNSIKRDVYAGPTRRPERGRGIMSSRIARLLEVATTPSKASFASGRPSGDPGTTPLSTPKNSANRSPSASSHDSICRTTTRKRINGLGCGSQSVTSEGAQVNS